LIFAVTDGSSSPCSQQPHLQAAQNITYVELPEDAWRLIYSSLPMRDAARAACVSRRFLRFWRCYPNLTFNQETVAAKRQPLPRGGEEDRGKYLFSKARQVLEAHSGVGATTLRLNLSTCREEDIDAPRLDGWLRAFATSASLREVALLLPESCARREYTFPYPLLLTPSSRVESLYLASCGFHPARQQHAPPTSSFGGSLLSRVCLRRVGTTGEELALFLSSCPALARLDLCDCDAVTSIEIPRVLRRLRTVRVQRCRALRAVRSDAPGLSSFHYEGWRPLSAFSLGDALETTELDVYATRMADVVQYAGARFPSVAPNLETLVLSSVHEVLYVAMCY
jgi:hypothetical protein